MPRFSRPDILFGVTVPETFAAGAGRALVSRYRTIVWVSAAAALAIGLLLRARQEESGWGAIMMSAATVESIPAFGDTLSGWGWFVVVPFMLFNFGVTVWMLRVGQGGYRAVAPGARTQVHGDAAPDHAWKVGGLYYVNPHDPAMWVENRFGFGYTLNFGNWRAWLLIIGVMLVPMVAGHLLF